MLSEDAFYESVKELAEANGIPLEEAGRLMVFIGDTPRLSTDGTKLVADGREWIIPPTWLRSEDGETAD